MFESIAFEKRHGTMRVWGTGETADESKRQCEFELVNYLKGRRDKAWSDFKIETRKKIERIINKC